MSKKVQSQKRHHKNPPNPIQITLDTPPNSPPTITLDNFDESPDLSLSFTPQKKQKKGHSTRSRHGLFIKDPVPAIDSISLSHSTFSDTIFSEPSDINSPPAAVLPEVSTEFSEASSSSFSDPFLDYLSRPLATDFYHEFVEAVLVNAMPFYPISKNVFVTQGWDTKNGLSTVRFPTDS
jgi:hypothetical protein